MNTPTIESVHTTIDSWGHASATAQFSDGVERYLFSWYSDELSFTQSDLKGLTEAEARALYTKRDVAWLQS